MTVHVTEDVLTASNGHLAYRRDDGRWDVSWLSDRTVTRDQALSALELAECVTRGAATRAHPDWSLIEVFAGELGMTADQAVAAVVRANAAIPNPGKRGPTTVGAIDSTIWRYQDAVRELDTVISIIEDIPVHQVPPGHSRTAKTVLADAYALRHACRAAANALDDIRTTP